MPLHIGGVFVLHQNWWCYVYVILSVIDGTCSCHVVAIIAPSSSHLHIPIITVAYLEPWVWGDRPPLHTGIGKIVRCWSTNLRSICQVRYSGCLECLLLLCSYASNLEYFLLMRCWVCAYREDWPKSWVCTWLCRLEASCISPEYMKPPSTNVVHARFDFLHKYCPTGPLLDHWRQAKFHFGRGIVRQQSLSSSIVTPVCT